MARIHDGRRSFPQSVAQGTGCLLLRFAPYQRAKPRNRYTMRVVVQNLQKRAGLATRLVELHDPDVFLAQEINEFSEALPSDSTEYYTSKRGGFGTAVYSKHGGLTTIRRVSSPHAEFGGFITKKTIVARVQDELDVVSFHGYNGQPWCDVDKLVDHVQAVVDTLDKDDQRKPCLFAGDFNTWTQAHVDAVKGCLERVGFVHVFSWPYGSRPLPLDHAFLRGPWKLSAASHYECASDHRGAILELEQM